MEVRGYIELLTTFGEKPLSRSVNVRYLVIDVVASCNVLIDRPCLNVLGAVVSTLHLAMKFPSTSGEIVTVRADQKEARMSYLASLKITRAIILTLEKAKSEPIAGRPEGTVNLVELDPWEDMTELRPQPMEPSEKVQLGSEPCRCTKIGTLKYTNLRESIVSLLKKNSHLFAWSASDMSGIDPDFLCH